MHALTKDLLEGRSPFHRVPSTIRSILQSFNGDLEGFLLGKNGQGDGMATVLDTPGVDPERLAKAMALYQAAHARHSTFERLTTCGLDTVTADLLADVAGHQGPGWLDKDPFVVASTLGWPAIERLRTSLGIPTDDPRFAAAAVGFVLRRKDENGTGDTLFSYDNLVDDLALLLGGTDQAHTALEHAWKDGRLSWSNAHGGGYLSLATAAMEEAIAEWAQKGVAHLPQTARQDAASSSGSLFASLDNSRSATDTPNAQEAAVRAILRYRIALVHGSAGTGKTNLLTNLIQAANQAHRRVFLLALAAKAARRIEESTGHQASTLERFLLSSAKARLRPSDIVVVDEAGMLCVADLYRLVRAAGRCSIALVGDPVQLPPIQAGRPFLDMLLSRRLPTVHLRHIYRQAAGNTILDFALAVREGDVDKAIGILESHAFPKNQGAQVLPEPSVQQSYLTNLQGVVHIEAKDGAMLPHLAIFHAQHPTASQILTGVKDGPNGVHAINRLLCKREGLALTLCGRPDLPVGTPVVLTNNLPEYGLDNGTLGKVLDTKRVVFLSGAGTTHTLDATPSMLAVLMPAYALTIHKAQGSQWAHVALAVGRSRLLDRSLLYTAATRAMEGLLILGTKADIAAAIAAPPRVLGLRTTLCHRITRTGKKP